MARVEMVFIMPPGERMLACNEPASKTRRDLYDVATSHLVHEKVKLQPAGEKK